MPQSNSSAQIIICDNSGKTLKAISVSGNGHSFLNADAATLSGGTYNYALIVDNKIVDIKKMILAK